MASAHSGPNSSGPGSRSPIYVILDNLRSAYNVGSIFRTADSVNAEKIILTGITPEPASKAFSKTALAASKTVPWSYSQTALAAVNSLKSRRTQIVALELTDQSTDYADEQYSFPLAIIVGHERRGIAAPALAEADKIVKIPMQGAGHSLNVASSFAVLSHHLLNQLRQ